MSKPLLHFRIDDQTELRALILEDAAPLFALVERNRAYLRAWLPWLDMTRTLEDEEAFIRGLQAHYPENGAITCGIWYKGEIAGTIGYHSMDWLNQKVEIGYWLGESFQGHGLITKSCHALVNYAFKNLHLNKVEIRCALDNTRSRAVPERLGFRQEGISRHAEWLYDHFVDLVLYGMLANEWRG